MENSSSGHNRRQVGPFLEASAVGHDALLEEHRQVVFELVVEPGFIEAYAATNDNSLPRLSVVPPLASWSDGWSEEEDKIILSLRGTLIERKDRTMNWEEIQAKLIGRTAHCCEIRFNQIINMSNDEYLALPKSTRPIERLPGFWGPHEDDIITRETRTSMHWEETAAKLTQRSAGEVKARHEVLLSIGHDKGRQRWQSTWTKADEEKLKALRDMGMPWLAISKRFPERTQSSCLQHYNRLRREGAYRPLKLTLIEGR